MASKYKNKLCECDGYRFHSILERDFYLYCKALKQQGLIYDFEMQKKYTLHAGIVYKLDFLIHLCSPDVIEIYPIAFYPRVIAVEVKGFWNNVAKLKKKLFEADFGTLEIHTKAKPWRLAP